MEPSIDKVIRYIEQATPVDVNKHAMRAVLLQFYKDRSIEILTHIEEQGLMLSDDDIKIGGTD